MSAVAQLAGLAARWRRRQRWIGFLRAAAVLLPSAAVVATLAQIGVRPVWTIALGAAGVFVAVTSVRLGRSDLSEDALARHLDAEVEAVEQSAELLLSKPESLPLVARLQRARIESRLAAAPIEFSLPAAALHSAAGWAVVAAVAAAAIPLAPRWMDGDVPAAPPRLTAAGSANGEPLGLRSVTVRVDPPPYTGLEPRETDQLDLVVEQGALVTWKVEPAGAPAAAALVFDELESFELEPLESGDAEWFSGSRRVEANHLYRLEMVGEGDRFESVFARLTVDRDDPPDIRIVEPVPYLELPAGRAKSIDVVAKVSDDYGLGEVAIVATVASGFGELVEFRERRFEFENQSTLKGKQPGATFSRRLDLRSLGVEPGVELFFHVEAADRREPVANRARSSTHIVRVLGGGPQSVGLSARLPVLRVPEFFRSQRQIILDTEKLLAEEERLTSEEFRRRSEAIGFDQRALRMRYGGLLGEEFSSGRPIGSDEGDDGHGAEDLRLDEMQGSDATAESVLAGLEEGLVHEHDSAEIATFFDSEIKATLKGALAEMWDAEGRLRSIEPRAALPYEYRALRLLKDVQQRSRLYVQKIGFEPPELFPGEKRLTGDLDGIRTVRERRIPEPSDEERQTAEIAAAISVLRQWQECCEVPEELEARLEVAARRLAARAREDPAVDLDGLAAVREIQRALAVGGDPSADMLAAAEVALWRLLPEPSPVPGRPDRPTRRLDAAYRARLAPGGGA